MFFISVKEVAGKITLKHLYEIAVIKSQDPTMDWKPLKEICVMLLGTARTCGIEVVRDLDAKVIKIRGIIKLNILSSHTEVGIKRVWANIVWSHGFLSILHGFLLFVSGLLLNIV